MTKVIVTPESSSRSATGFRAAARGHESVGNTPGAALDALACQLSDRDANTFVVVQNMRPDEFFTAAQQDRLSELLAVRRAAQQGGRQLDTADEAELELLVQAELDGAARRAAAMIQELRS
jgi:hypothetical protein